MYIITSEITGDISTDDYKTAQAVARLLHKELNTTVYIAELIMSMKGKPELLIVAEYKKES